VTEISPAELGQIRLEPVGQRHRLCIDHGAELVEVGLFLREADRAWLVEVLRRWAAEHRPAGPAVPGDGVITAEHGPGGRLTIRWPPSDPQLLRDRQVMAGGVIGPVIVAPIMAVAVWIAITIALALREQWSGWGAFGLGFVLLWVLGLGWNLAALLPGYWYALRGPRWARLTLTAQALTYEPGRYIKGKQVFAGPRRVIPRPELGEVRLDPVEGRQRLTVDHGAERIEIGPELRDPERRRLAEMLRAWAGQQGRESA
jgi:hypothetical protein